MENDATVTFASANWLREPLAQDPYHQLAGVLPAKRQNTEFLDESNTWLITANIDSRPRELPMQGAFATTRAPRPSYLVRPGDYPNDCPLDTQARIREAIEREAAGMASTQVQTSAMPLQQPATGLEHPLITLQRTTPERFELPQELVQLERWNDSKSNAPLIIGLVGVALLIVLLMQASRR